MPEERSELEYYLIVNRMISLARAPFKHAPKNGYICTHQLK
jgi:hypothetical protein